MARGLKFNHKTPPKEMENHLLLLKRRNAVSQISEMGNFLESLIAGSAPIDISVKEALIKTIAQLGSKSGNGTKYLRTVILREENVGVVFWAIKSLQGMNHSSRKDLHETVKVLDEALNGKKAMVADTAAIALKNFLGHEAIPYFLKASKNPECLALGQVALQLSELKSKDAIEPIIKMLPKENQIQSILKDVAAVMRTIGLVKVLGEIGDKSAIEPLRKLKASFDNSSFTNDKIKKELLPEINTAILTINSSKRRNRR